MDMREHIYADDPNVGHPDVRTDLTDVNYFFIGNGYVQAAVQVCRSGEGTPLGLLIMHPDRFGSKRETLTCHEDEGLTGTIVSVHVGDEVHSPAASELTAAWDTVDGVPAVRVSWKAGTVDVVEHLYCPGRSTPRLYRRVSIDSTTAGDREVLLSSGHDIQTQELVATESNTATLIYEVKRDGDEPTVVTRWKRGDHPSADAIRFWTNLTRCETGIPKLDHLYATASCQLPTAVDAIGRMDGSIWQYNLEWVRDQAHVTEALVRLGNSELAKTMLARILDDFVANDGDVIDSGRHREPIEVELDQNGELLSALRTYVDWTGDLDLVRERWDKVKALASFPLSQYYRHEESGLLHNAREYWERHGGHGIEDGCELMHQFFVAVGLDAAAYLSDVTGCSADRDAWSEAAASLRHAFLEHRKFRLIEDGHFIKRRGLDGAWQRSITRSDECVLPSEIPLMEDGPRRLDPDTSSTLPIAYAFIDPFSELAAGTLAHMEEIWNQRWDTGGYGRYNAESEADSAGPWPFASLFVARASVEAKKDDIVWRILRWLADAPGSLAGSWFEFFGNRIAPPYAQVGIIPWTWAEMITLYLHHILGIRPDLDGVTLRPHLLSGLDRMNANVMLRGHSLRLAIRRAASDAERGAQVGEEFLKWQSDGVRMPHPDSDIDVTILC